MNPSTPQTWDAQASTDEQSGGQHGESDSTRTAIITGRNHHSVGFGVISEGATGFPGCCDNVIPKGKATIQRKGMV